MRKAISVVMGMLFLAGAAHKALGIEMTWEFSVQVSATVQASPAQITLTWPQDQYMLPTSYTVYRKAPTDTSWGNGTTLPGTATSYVDSNVQVGVPYEYQIVKVTSQYTSYGYIYSGINLPMMDYRGKLLLVVDNTYASQLANELARLQQDLTGDGWTVIRLDVNRTDSVVSVKNLIKAQYLADPTNVQCVFLFGHVPVPYSGDIVPDGHTPDHQGAWPCDGYYGDMDGLWTDNSVNVTGQYDPRNTNVPGDGKFDQSTFPAPIKLMVGRVDLANMPGALWYGGPSTFPSELDLLRNYLNKDHNFRTKQFDLPRRAIMGDFFGVRSGEAFAASGWRNFSTFFGASNVNMITNMGDWTPTLHTNSYLWAYGCGAGSFTSVAGLGNSDTYYDLLTREMWTNDIHAAFTLLFGSWFGDWDSQDNLMRGVLALPTYGLTCAWSGRPHWFMHHMAMGFPIGYSARLTQNNGPNGLYQNEVNSAAGQIHIALMGDPSLRMHVVAPPSNVTAMTNGGSVTLNWTGSSDQVIGYLVYGANATNGVFTRLTTTPITATTYTDNGASGSTNYMVRAVKLETSSSGTYYNPSEGAFLAPLAAVSTTGSAGGSTGGSTNSVTSTNNPAGGALQNPVSWVDDSLPAGAVPGTDGGDAWNWVSSNPTPFSGTLANQSTSSAGLHQHYFTFATQTLTVNSGDVLFAYVYLDPANLPSEIMLQWNDGSWEHRAYWGADNIGYGSGSTTGGHAYMGPLPPAGQWVLLAVPGSTVGLQGSTINGMAFSQFDGRATWDYAGKASALLSSSGSGTNNAGSGSTNTGSGGTSTNNPTNGGTTNSTGTSNSSAVIWVGNSLPTGAVPGADGGDAWNWVSSNPAPFSGTQANQSTIGAGLHQHYFASATQTLPVNTGDYLFAYVYLDPANLPSEVMLQWNDGSSWEHRAYWGADKITYGNDGTAGRMYMGPLPQAGQWALLQVPASQVALEGSTVSGMSFSQVDGRATWDDAGKSAGPLTSLGGSSGTTTNTTTTNTPATGVTNTSGTVLSNAVDWVDDSLPAGAVPGADFGDAWNWVSNNPTPFSGTQANQSTISAGLHQHYFSSATQTLAVNSGDIVFAYVYLDPANVPTEIMLQWNDGSSWEHRAYWGADEITYGADGTPGRVYMGPLPTPGQWVLLAVPASQVGLGGTTLSGMAFSQFDGRATWDYAGKASALATLASTGGTTNGSGLGSGGTTGSTDTNTVPTGTNTVSNGGSPGTNVVSTGTNNNGGTGTNTASTGTNSVPTGTNTIAAVTNAIPGISSADYVTTQIPDVGDNSLHILSPTLLELTLINTKQPDPAQVAQWNLVANSQFSAPPTSAFAVTANGQTIPVTTVGFKRRPLYAPMKGYDLRIQNCLYLQLAAPISDNQTVVVQNTDGSLWPSSMTFSQVSNPLRYSPAIHVNQEGYMPGYSKTAMVGYYLGSLGEMSIPASSGFELVDANTGAQVYQGTLTQRRDSGYTYSPSPYQQVYEADFSSFTTPGEYRLVVPGMGGSLPFLINDGIAMDFARAYALGLYEQRCGTNVGMPYTRFTHDKCHAAPASVPSSVSAYPFTWTTISNYALSLNANNPPQIAPALTSPSASLFPYINQGPVDVSGGHHDAGDYSKYTINSASLIHYLMFEVDSFPGVAALDNLGIPESGDGISDVMQEAKWEADFLAKMQDADGGFYFLVYPQNREYEDNVTPDHGDPQVVWPKTTSVTAAAVAALAQCASSPLFKKTYPATAAMYLQKAQLGWQFLTNAIAKYGKNGAYQKITSYGDDFADNDEMAWAACQMYLATGDPSIQQLLLSWFDPSDPATWRWGWWHMSESYGNAIRSYAFAVQSGRLTSSQLDPTFLGKCQAEIAAAANDVLSFCQENAYGTSFPTDTKAVQSAGWYFSCDQAFDLAVAYQLNPSTNYLNAMLQNVNFEGGCNPVNVCYVTGLGWKRQRDIVSQWALNANKVLPPSGLPVGNIIAGFNWLWDYAGELEGLSFPSDSATTAPYPYYDRWADSWNVTAEMVVLNQARGLGMLAFLAAQTPYKTQPWVAPNNATINVPTNTVAVGSTVTLSLQVPGMDLTGARITWEGSNQQTAYGQTFDYVPDSNGTNWVEAEAQWPDGRRAFAHATFNANSPNVVWVDGSLPAGAVPGADGGDSWNWVTSNPTPLSSTPEHQSVIAAGEHQQFFTGATATLSVSTGDVLYAYVYLDPANMPSEIMLQWNDGSSWNHRAYWGADTLGYGADGTPGRVNMGALPPAGQWVQLKVPASQVGLEGVTVSGMAFTCYGGRATWDAAGLLSPSTGVAASLALSLDLAADGATLSWPSISNKVYQVSYKDALNEPAWTPAAQITAVAARLSWTDPASPIPKQRFYLVAQSN